MTINWQEQAETSYQTAIENGFSFNNIEQCKTDILGEFNEALQHIANKGDGAWFQGSKHEKSVMWLDPRHVCIDTYKNYLAETVEMELVDVKLRTCSLANSLGMPLEPCGFSEIIVKKMDRINTIEELSQCCANLLSLNHYFAVIDCVYQWMKMRKINVDWFIEVKQNYNKIRTY